MIDAYERRDVATADAAGAYLKATMDDYVLIKFVGESVNGTELRKIGYSRKRQQSAIRTFKQSVIWMCEVGPPLV